MRVAILVVSLCLAMIIALQSCGVMIGAGILDKQETASSGAAGIALAFLFVLGAAFALGIPIISCIIFAFGAVLGFVAAAESEFTDLKFWASVSAILALMSLFGFFELRRKKRREAHSDLAARVTIQNLLAKPAKDTNSKNDDA
jgi:hypothetical protein